MNLYFKMNHFDLTYIIFFALLFILIAFKNNCLLEIGFNFNETSDYFLTGFLIWAISYLREIVINLFEYFIKSF